MASTFQTSVLDPVAQVVGGTAPDPQARPRWFSGKQVGDSSGIVVPASDGTSNWQYPDFKGCHSAPPEFIEDYPVGIVLPGSFTIEGGNKTAVFTSGSELNTDDLRLLIILARVDTETTYSNMLPYRDLVPAQFAAHMTAFGNVLQAFPIAGKPVTITWANSEFDALEFTIRVLRMVNRSYVS